jgi:hypothetical protein
MSYEEIRYSDGSSTICFRSGGSINRKFFYDSRGRYHRELGPAQTWYNENGSINLERFYVNGVHLGDDKEGFLMLWGRLSDEKRQSPEILKCLAKYL